MDVTKEIQEDAVVEREVVKTVAANELHSPGAMGWSHAPTHSLSHQDNPEKSVALC